MIFLTVFILHGFCQMVYIVRRFLPLEETLPISIRRGKQDAKEKGAEETREGRLTPGGSAITQSDIRSHLSYHCWPAQVSAVVMIHHYDRA